MCLNFLLNQLSVITCIPDNKLFKNLLAVQKKNNSKTFYTRNITATFHDLVLIVSFPRDVNSILWVRTCTNTNYRTKVLSTFTLSLLLNRELYVSLWVRPIR